VRTSPSIIRFPKPLIMCAPAEAEQSDLANARLGELYNPHLESWRRLRQSNPGLSIPMLLKTSPAYFAAKPRVLFVGQETHGWWDNCEIQAEDLAAGQIMDFYAGLKKWLHENYRHSPYWNAVRHITAGLKINDPSDSYLVSNIFPCDVDKKQAPLALHDVFREWRVLPGEAQILEPDWIIFFCGPRYVGNLEAYFREWPSKPLTKADSLIEYNPSGQSWRGLVTYHPNALQRLKLMHVLDDILQKIVHGNQQAGGLQDL
jgi:hypothetical protein